jgi:hypothetical protein
VASWYESNVPFIALVANEGACLVLDPTSTGLLAFRLWGRISIIRQMLAPTFGESQRRGSKKMDHNASYRQNRLSSNMLVSAILTRMAWSGCHTRIPQSERVDYSTKRDFKITHLRTAVTSKCEVQLGGLDRLQLFRFHQYFPFLYR